MKHFSFLTLLFAFLIIGCAHSPDHASSPVVSVQSHESRLIMVASNSEQIPLTSPEKSVKSENKEDVDDEEDLGDYDEIEEEERATIADPLEPFNRAMHQFNDKLYFWLLKPVAQGYSTVVPEGARVSVKNFFTNLAFPLRFISCLLQADFSGAATEVGRFSVNTVWGVGGLLDPSSKKELDLPKQDTDLGQTLGVYGVGQGFYIVWPVLGPSSARDTIEIAGEYFFNPVSFIEPWYASMGVRGYEAVNATSLRIGDYESLKEAAIDPYVALRDAYVQYRENKVKRRRAKFEQSIPAGMMMDR